MDGYGGLAGLILGLSSRFTTQYQIELLAEFAETHSELLGAYRSTIEAAINTANYELFWASNNLDIIEEQLQRKTLFTVHPHRLSEEVLPIHYDILLTPYFESNSDHQEWTFDGEVKITVKATESGIRSITLHKLELDIFEVSVIENVDSDLELFEDFTYDEETNKFTIHLNDEMDPEKFYNLRITYLGYLGNEMIGFYRSIFFEDGQNKRMASTQFQSNHARRAFPCFDEPKFKATFQVRIRRERHYLAHSNTKRLDTIAIADTEFVEDIFDVTPIMSSYLVAFVVSFFSSRSTLDHSFNVWTRTDMYPQTLYGYDVGMDILAYLDEYTEFPYYDMIDKMDMAAIPDFSAGAMENWGLITYRETNLVYDPALTAPFAKQRIATVIAHEQAHMWFGDLVTCDWWTVVWLNEGFATYHQYFSTGMVETGWDLDLQFVVEQQQVAFQVDSTNFTHPMNYEGNSMAEISGMISNIHYNKAGSVIRMIEHFVGYDNFRAGIRQYLKENAYSTAVPEKLYSALQDHTDGSVNVAEVFGSWADQAGYPVLQVSFNKDRTQATLSQKRFMIHNKDHNDETIYQIPITYATKNGFGFEETGHRLILTDQETTIPINSEDIWTIFNVQQVGYYRVNYDEESWDLILKALKKKDFDGIHVLNRAQIVDDALNLARGGLLSYAFAFDVLDYLDHETSYIPWLAAFNGLSYLSRRAVNSKSEKFEKYIQKILEGVYEHLGFEEKEDDSQIDHYNRANVLQWACRYKHEDCVKNAMAEFNKAKSDSSYLVPVDIRPVVYCTGVRNGNLSDFDWLWQKFSRQNVATEQVLVLNALGCTRDEAAVKQYLDAIFTDVVRKHDKTAAFTALYSNNDDNVDKIWGYIVENEDKIVESVGSFGGLVSLISGLSTRFTSQTQLDVLAEFTASHLDRLGSVENGLSSAINSANYELYWESVYLDEVENQLKLKNMDFRLKENVHIEHYNVLMTPYFEAEGDHEEWTFDGDIKISIETPIAGVRNLTLHYEDLIIHEISVYENEIPDNIITIEYHYEPETFTLFVNLETPLPTNTLFTVRVWYLGKIRDDMTGFYRTIYHDEDGVEKRMAATQMRTTYARRVYPCFDEPSFKGSYQIRMRRYPNYTVVSNKKITFSVPVEDSERIEDVFGVSPAMAPYLVAFMVFEYTNRTSPDESLGVWARPDVMDQTEYAYEIAMKMRTFYENFTVFPYEMIEKLELVALEYYDAEATENWGMMQFSEANLLYHKTLGTPLGKQRIATAVSHQEAHMYYGNLATCDWWGHIWMHEAFATYHQYVSTAKVEPLWELELQFTVDQMHVAFQLDASNYTYTMNQEVTNRYEINAVFNTITYQKGSSVVRMLDHLMRHDRHMSGIRKYFRDNRFKTATPDLLYLALQSSGQTNNISQIMKSWVDQEGYPVLQVDINASRNETILSQRRFLIHNKDHTDDTIYHIAITHTNKNQYSFLDTTNRVIFNVTSMPFVINARNSWSIFNVQQVGYYRVNYDEVSWRLIIDALLKEDFDGIHVLNRAQIVDDVLNLARGGLLSYKFAFEVLEYLDHETSFVPWTAALNGLSYLNRRLAKNKIERMSKYIHKKMARLYESVGFYGDFLDPQDVIFNRINTLKVACKYDYPDCVENSRIEFNSAKASASYLVSGNRREVVYCTAIRHGDESDWDWLWDKFTQQTVASEQVLILSALGCTNNEAAFNKFMGKIFSDDIKKQDKIAAFQSTYKEHDGNVERILDYIVQNRDSVAQLLGGYEELSLRLSDLATRFTKPEQIQTLMDFSDVSFDLLRSSQSTIRSAIRTANYEMYWESKHATEIDNQIRLRILEYRLPSEVTPLAYDLTITPYLEAEDGKEEWTFDGHVEIIIMPTAPNVQTITLHAHDLEIDTISVIDSLEDEPLELFDFSDYEEETHKLTIYLNSALDEEKAYTITINYRGYLRGDNVGFYRNVYYENGEEKRMGATQFQTTRARRAFPCFDEPRFKSSFQLNIIRSPKYVSISNTMLYGSIAIEGSDKLQDIFYISPRMSTYLVAFIVSEYTVRSTEDYKFRVWARPDMYAQTEYAHSIGMSLLEYFNSYTQHSYDNMIPKMDMAAIPDFGGAMENWGLLTYHESLLLVDSEKTTALAKQRIAAVIAHEQAHMWFGNLVTCEWWNTAWLNEGFAQYHQYFSTAKVETMWDLDKQFVVEQLQSVFQIDSANVSHPMIQEVNTPAEVSGHFDSITYTKGASIIRMMEHLIGSDNFQAGIRNYLKANEYTSSTPDKLYSAMQNVADESINFAQVMSSWTEQPGYPVLDVKINTGRFMATLTQKRFHIQNRLHEDQTLYHIPITYATKTGYGFEETAPRTVMENATAVVFVETQNTWTIFNVQQVGYYRVNYDEVSWNFILEGLLKPAFDGIHVLNRAQIVDDALNLARGGLLTYEFALNVLDYLDNETNYIPWLAAFNGLDYLRVRFENYNFASFPNFVLKRLENIYNHLGFYGKVRDTQTDIYNRDLVQKWACRYGHEDCVRNAMVEFEKARSDSTYLIPGAVRQNAYCTGIMTGGQGNWDWLWEKFTNEDLATEQVLILSALGCTTNVNSVHKYLDMIFSSAVRRRDRTAAFVAAYSEAIGNANRVWTYVVDNHANMAEVHMEPLHTS